MLIFITGATGFIGSHLAERLASKGHKLRCLARETSETEGLSKLNAEIVMTDMNDPAGLKKALEGVDIVYHCAAMVGEWLSKEEAGKINISGTKNLLDASMAAGVKRFVHVSSLAVLGMRHHYSTPPEAPYTMTGDIYSDTKIESEKIVMDYHRRKGLPIVIVRPGFVFGLRDRRFLPRMLKLLDDNKFAFLGSGNNIMNLVYIDNLIDVLIEAGINEKAIGQKYNVTNKDKVTMRDFVYMISDIRGIKRPNKSIPTPLARLIADSLEFYGRLTKSQTPPFLTKARIKVASLNLDFDISKTMRDLGYDSKITIREGLEKTLNS
ncbi:MAG: NAD-dependent epimerase/dehydratase family protein [Candidatus Omnitrophica bacterium]|nr:NAD-dependent epimerase/dehydratase family protein [Candidatus Omnitrophota bacterium]MBU4488455.1 NAD-dependent epimerase/dehydratase family protein [Candidatus Omnitrophota bacterium]MCG2705651.1 NAD-dependent epimerase/dehydratase family protein [Candidatus Omnitrophota bacterium]